jgi:excisionase family DNA binding protein
MPQQTMQDDPWLTVKEAAEMLDISRHLVLSRAARGELQTATVAKRLVVSRASVEAALAGGA